MGGERTTGSLTPDQVRDVATILRAWLPGTPADKQPTWDEWNAASKRLYGVCPEDAPLVGATRGKE